MCVCVCVCVLPNITFRVLFNHGKWMMNDLLLFCCTFLSIFFCFVKASTAGFFMSDYLSDVGCDCLPLIFGVAKRSHNQNKNHFKKIKR